MADRPIDVLVIGASGFTGAQVCKQIARAVASGTWTGLTWGIAGRSKEKLEAKVLTPICNEGLVPPEDSNIMCVNNSDAATLREVLKRARLCLNCTGPYRFLGEAVVSVCVDVGTDYIDLCGEPEFMQRMVLKYHEAAEAKGVLVMHACAFDSVPADLGCLFTSRQFKAPAVCSAISSYLSIHTGPAGYSGHATTFEAAVHGFGSAQELRKLRREVRAKFPPPEVPRVGPRPTEKAGPFFEEAAEINAYCFKFPGADAAVVRSTQNSLVSRGQGEGLCPHYAAYFTAGNWWGASLVTVFGGVFQTLAKTTWGRSLLLRSPGTFTNGMFSHEGPTEEQMSQTSFDFTFIAKGYSSAPAASSDDASAASVEKPDMRIVTRVRGPEPGYVATPIIFLEVARCVLEERTSLPVSGGVYTPGSVFVESTLVDRLKKNGVVFEVLDSATSA